jgi:hypothetical protein
VRGAATKAAGAPSGKRLGLADVQHVVAVASGKGGVGKSTVAGASTVCVVCVRTQCGRGVLAAGGRARTQRELHS